MEIRTDICHLPGGTYYLTWYLRQISYQILLSTVNSKQIALLETIRLYEQGSSFLNV